VQDPSWHAIWWLILPILLTGAILFNIWLRHRRIRETLELMRTYVAQGKDPPAELLDSLKERDDWTPGNMGTGWWRNPQQAWHGALGFGCGAAGFWLWGVLEPEPWPHHSHGPLVLAILMGAVALASLLTALFWHAFDGK
jgi:hypothetical protein